jgi:deoxyribose-phosphate aldolase
MTGTVPLLDQDLDFDNGYFDSAAFAAQTLDNWQMLASVIDHTLLKPDATRDQVEILCDEVIRYRFACAMVNPIWVSTAVSVLSGTGIPVGVVIGFPLGASLVSTLRQEATTLVRLGARELDMVLPIGLLKSGNHEGVYNSIHTSALIAHDHDALLKVILENCLLTVEEKLRASEIAIRAGHAAHQGHIGGGGAAGSESGGGLDEVCAGARCGVKAAGGIRTLANVKSLLEAGANRIGASASVSIVRELGAE